MGSYSVSAVHCGNTKRMSSNHLTQSLITLTSLVFILCLTIVGLRCINDKCRVGCQYNKTKGNDYVGDAHRTKNGDTCLSWNTHADWDIYDHNHCRNPTRKIKLKEAVWCYTGMGNTWDYCDVPWCLTNAQESMNTTEVEKEVIPVINTATIILGTVALFLGIVIFLILGSWFCNSG